MKHTILLFVILGFMSWTHALWANDQEAALNADVQTSEQANTPEQAGAKKLLGGKTIKVHVPEELSQEQRQFFAQCVDEVNAERRETGQDQIEVVSKGAKTRQGFGRALGAAALTIGIAVTPLGGAASAGRMPGDRAVAKDQQAYSAVLQCVGRHQGEAAQAQAREQSMKDQEEMIRRTIRIQEEERERIRQEQENKK